MLYTRCFSSAVFLKVFFIFMKTALNKTLVRFSIEIKIEMFS